MKAISIIRPFHNPNITILTNCIHIIKLISLYYGNNAICDYSDIGVVIEINCSGDKYVLRYNNSTLITDTPLQEINRIAFEITTFDESIFALHAAAVEYKGKAHIFIAATTSGKSTLTAFLTSSGMGYITDDCALIDKMKLVVYPYIIPIHIRQGGMKVLYDYQISFNDTELVGDGSLRRYIYTPQNYISKSLGISDIYFISRSENINSITEMTMSQGIERLTKSPITPYKISGEYINLLSKISKIGCKNLIYSDMNFVKQIIEETK